MERFSGARGTFDKRLLCFDQPHHVLSKIRPAMLAHKCPRGLESCPHRQIRRTKPGNCLICGMALEPLEPTAEERTNPEMINMTRRSWVSAALARPRELLAMGTEIRKSGSHFECISTRAPSGRPPSKPFPGLTKT